MVETVKVKVGDRWYTVVIEDLDANPVRANVDGDPVDVEIGRSEVEGPEHGAATVPQPTRPEAPPEPRAIEKPLSSASFKKFTSPMPGVIISVSVAVGDQVVTGDEICVLEAMKMRQSLKADWSGIVRVVHVAAGQHVTDGDIIAELE